MEVEARLSVASLPSFDEWYKYMSPEFLKRFYGNEYSESQRLQELKEFKQRMKVEAAYWNRYEEIRAYMNNVLNEIREDMRGRRLNPRNPDGTARSVHDDLSDALNKSYAWNQMSLYLGRKSKNILLKGLVTALEDEGIIKIE